MLNSFQRYTYLKTLNGLGLIHGSVGGDKSGWGLNELIQVLCPNRWQSCTMNVGGDYLKSQHLRTKQKKFLKDNGQLSIQQILSTSRSQTMY